MKILLTGGAGFVGKSVIESLISNLPDCSILSLTRNATSNPFHRRMEWFECDLGDSSTYADRVKQFSPDVVIHLAWDGIPDFSLEKCLQNIQLSIDFFKIIFSCKSIKKIIVTGSCFEYNRLNGLCSETDICISKDYFTWSKNVLRDFLQVETKKLDIVFCWARLFYVYGPHQRSASLIPTIIHSLSSGKIPDIRTPANSNDFIFVDDVASGILEMIKNEIQSSIFNFGSGVSTAILDVCKICDLSINGSLTLSSPLENLAQNSVKTVDFWADIEWSKSKLNWKPVTSLQEGIAKTLRIYLENNRK